MAYRFHQEGLVETLVEIKIFLAKLASRAFYNMCCKERARAGIAWIVHIFDLVAFFMVCGIRESALKVDVVELQLRIVSYIQSSMPSFAKVDMQGNWVGSGAFEVLGQD